MKKATKIIALLLCAVLLVGATIAGTVAYLTANDSVENTFTVGNVAIKLEEYKIGEDGKKTNEVVEGQANIKLVPGREIQKEPFITVLENSEECWLMVKIENQLAAAGTISMAAGWEEVTAGSGVYVYGTSVTPTSGRITVFNTFTVNKDLTDLTSFNGKKITVTAYAVQKEGFANAKAAWNATFGAPTTT